MSGSRASHPEAGEVLYTRAEFESSFRAPPVFFVVGAQKAGTSTLHELLAAVARSSMPEPKETHFFNRDENYRRGPSWYRGWFSDDAPGAVCGEVDPEYLFSPVAAGRIATAAPRARLVVVLREPLARAHSHYRMSVRRGLEELTFPQALENEAERLGDAEHGEAWRHFSYVQRGLYAAQIERYLSSFPRENLRFVRFEDLVGEGTRLATLLGIQQHVGLDVEPDDLPTSGHANRASEARVRMVTRFLHRDSVLKRMVRPWLPFPRLRLRLAMAIDRWNRKPLVPGPDATVGDVPRTVVTRIAQDVAVTQELTGLDLSAWMESYE